MERVRLPSLELEPPGRRWKSLQKKRVNLKIEKKIMTSTLDVLGTDLRRMYTGRIG